MTERTIKLIAEPERQRTRADDAVQYDTSRTGCQRSASSRIEPSRANTTQAFLLGEYWSSPRPDVLLVFSNTHDHQRLSQYAADVDQMARLIDALVPTSTRIVWTSKHAEHDRKKPPASRNKRYVQVLYQTRDTLSLIHI